MHGNGRGRSTESTQQVQHSGVGVDALPEALALVKSGALAGTY